MSNDNNDLLNRSKWRIKKEIEYIANDEEARKRKELDGMEGLLP